MGATTDVLVDDVRVGDPLPTLNAFQIDEGDEPPRLEDSAATSVMAAAAARVAVMARSSSRDLAPPPPPRSFHDVTFANVTVANLSQVRWQALTGWPP